MQRFGSTALLIGAMILAPLSADAAMKIAVVDVQSAMEASKHWKEAVQKLEKERTTRQATLEKEQAGLRKKKEQLDAQKAVVDPKSLVSQEEELIRDGQKLRQSFMQNQQALTMLEKRLTDQMLTRIENVVRQVAVEGDYTFVFEAGPDNQPNVWYAKPKVDITKRVIASYKKAYANKPLEIRQ